jgi:glycosyltransferase involved in cell wall biosynthesis
MKISLHMPAYNAEATIGSALKSLLRQREAGDLDIVVIDDGSVDRTCDVVLGLAARAPEIRLISVAHGGISKARNAALQAMAPDADIVGFLDADDLSPEGRLARDVDAFQTDPTIDFIYSTTRFFDVEDAERLAPSVSSHSADGRIVNLAAGMFRRRLLDQVGPFDETLVQAEDLDFLLRIFERDPKYLLSEQIGVFYRKNHGGITENRRQARRELMRALLRAHKRQGQQVGQPRLPQGVIINDEMEELRSWVR